MQNIIQSYLIAL